MTPPAPSINQQIVITPLCRPYPSKNNENIEAIPYVALDTGAAPGACDCFYYQEGGSVRVHFHKLRLFAALSFVLFFILGGAGLHTAAHNDKWTPGAQAEMVFSLLFFAASLFFCAISIKKHGC
jgi:hypothetical protein